MSVSIICGEQTIRTPSDFYLHPMLKGFLTSRDLSGWHSQRSALKFSLEYQGSFGRVDQSRTTDLGKPAGQGTKQPQFWLRCRKQQTNLEMHSPSPRDVANDVLWEAGLLSIPQRASSPPPTSVIPVSGFQNPAFFLFFH